MYWTSTGRRTLAIGGVSLVAVVGLIGWTRRGEEPFAAPSSYAAARFGDPEPVSRDPNIPVVYAPSPFAPNAPIVPAKPVATASARPARPVRVVSQRRHYRRRIIVRRRPFRRSAAIVGGSAAGGALVGALAGGGKGAAIGALAGGGGGLVYDRLTHKRVVREP